MSADRLDRRTAQKKMRALKRCEVLSAGRRHRRPLRKRVGKVLFEVVAEFKRGEGGVKQTHASADGHVLARGGSSKKVKKKNEPTNDDGGGCTGSNRVREQPASSG